jgi:hypothetical protein
MHFGQLIVEKRTFVGECTSFHDHSSLLSGVIASCFLIRPAKRSSKALSQKGEDDDEAPLSCIAVVCSQGIIGYLSGSAPADHLYVARIKPIVRNGA